MLDVNNQFKITHVDMKKGILELTQIESNDIVEFEKATVDRWTDLMSGDLEE